MTERLTDARIDELFDTYLHAPSIRSLLEEVRERRAVEKSCTKPVTPNDHLDLIYETAIARAEKEGTNR